MSLREDLVYGLADLGVEAVKITNSLVHGVMTKKFDIVFMNNGRRYKAQIELADNVLRQGNDAIISVIRSILRSEKNYEEG